MSKVEFSVEEIFLRLGTSPATRAAKANQVFRRLREQDEKILADSLTKSAVKLDLTEADKADDLAQK